MKLSSLSARQCIIRWYIVRYGEELQRTSEKGRRIWVEMIREKKLVYQLGQLGWQPSSFLDSSESSKSKIHSIFSWLNESPPGTLSRCVLVLLYWIPCPLPLPSIFISFCLFEIRVEQFPQIDLGTSPLLLCWLCSLMHLLNFIISVSLSIYIHISSVSLSIYIHISVCVCVYKVPRNITFLFWCLSFELFLCWF